VVELDSDGDEVVSARPDAAAGAAAAPLSPLREAVAAVDADSDGGIMVVGNDSDDAGGAPALPSEVWVALPIPFRITGLARFSDAEGAFYKEGEGGVFAQKDAYGRTLRDVQPPPGAKYIPERLKGMCATSAAEPLPPHSC